MLTQTEVLETVQPPIPPCVRVTVPISAPPTDISSVMLVAETAGTIANIVAMANSSRSESYSCCCAQHFLLKEDGSGKITCMPIGEGNQ
jgi:hypothetical protein